MRSAVESLGRLQMNRVLGIGSKTETYLFSRYFDETLASAKINPNRRFARFGKFVAALWKIPAFRRLAHGPLLRPAHVLFGFPLNAVLRKTKKA